MRDPGRQHDQQDGDHGQGSGVPVARNIGEDLEKSQDRAACCDPGNVAKKPALDLQRSEDVRDQACHRGEQPELWPAVGR